MRKPIWKTRWVVSWDIFVIIFVNYQIEFCKKFVYSFNYIIWLQGVSPRQKYRPRIVGVWYKHSMNDHIKFKNPMFLIAVLWSLLSKTFLLINILQWRTFWILITLWMNISKETIQVHQLNSTITIQQCIRVGSSAEVQIYLSNDTLSTKIT